ncbi:DNA modification methylase [Arenibacter sp. 6A1]|uniref:DNA modification methylase n=1 Tax=Arenibacter sp. 6A1 TaxID=2720391 RepID=UPI0014486412|nr:DNA modification methylase [Arenibacter sp. 6A1]NKI28256.1 DNA modification methylase [Arenibacter sp. 6A1]
MIDILAPLEWHTEKRIVKDLVPYNYNPRKISPERLEKLKNSLEKYNLAEIPVINTENIIVAGHQRVKVLMALGRGEELIDVRVPNRAMTEQEFKEYNIVSNVSVGYWDTEILEECFADIDLMDLGLDVNNIELPEDVVPSGFKQEEEQDFDPTPAKTPITIFGDVYELSSKEKGLLHRVVCGDSTNTEDYKTLLNGELFDLVVTDPPYNVNYQGGTKEKLTIQNDKMSNDDFYTFLYMFYQETFLNAKPGASIYVFHADSEGANFRNALKDSGYKLAQCLIWLKNSLVMGRQDYHWKHEPILYGWKEGAAHPWYSDRKQTTVLEFDKPLRNGDHPTMKPLEIIMYIVKNSSKQKNIVGDLFLGSGSTLIACEQTWRNCYGMELDPIYADVDIRRWISYMLDNDLEFEVKKNGKSLSEIEWRIYLDK